MLVRACALGQASSSLFAAHAIGKTPAELVAARDTTRPHGWRATGRCPIGPTSISSRPRWPSPRGIPRSAWRSKPAADAARQGSRLMGDGSMLRDGVVMLGAGLVFVILFRRLGLGATLGFLVAGALIGPQAFHLIGDARGQDRRRRARHHAAAVHRRARTQPEPAVEDEAGHLRARRAAGRRVRARGGGDRPLRSATRPGRRRWCSACRSLCRRPRRCCRCCNRRGGCAPRSASARSRSCCFRICRSSR